MRQLIYKEPLGPVSAEAVSDLENRLSVRLPDDYKTFLTLSGGGFRPEPHLADVPTWPPGVVLSSVYGIFPGDTLDLSKQNMTVEMYVPACFLNFGNDPGGQLFVIDLQSDLSYFGKIYVRDHDHAMNENPFLSAEFFEQYDCDPDERFLYHYIAGSFTEFLDMLYSDDDG